MSQFPDTIETQETEAIMAAIVNGKSRSTEKYNRCFEAVYALLCEISERERGTREKGT